ncbi:hypothetical protein LIER_25161 [Lithospermum erythrorhizon]|uniref:Uncharacterized protein n=1 Tax=Lithospermum erythrorhizon TaxID=34254 RepID=A0AAV3R5W2_LITER
MAEEYIVLNKLIKYTIPSEWPPNPKETSFPYLPLFSLSPDNSFHSMADESNKITGAEIHAALGTDIVENVMNKVRLAQYDFFYRGGYLLEGVEVFENPSAGPGGVDVEEKLEVFAASVPTDPSADVIGLKSEEVSTEEAGVKELQTLSGFRAKTSKTVVVMGHLRHLRFHYAVEKEVKMKVPLEGEVVDSPADSKTWGSSALINKVTKAKEAPSTSAPVSAESIQGLILDLTINDDDVPALFELVVVPSGGGVLKKERRRREVEEKGGTGVYTPWPEMGVGGLGSDYDLSAVPEGDLLAVVPEQVVPLPPSNMGKSNNPPLFRVLKVSTPSFFRLLEVMCHQGSFPGEMLNSHHLGCNSWSYFLSLSTLARSRVNSPSSSRVC